MKLASFCVEMHFKFLLKSWYFFGICLLLSCMPASGEVASTDTPISVRCSSLGKSEEKNCLVKSSYSISNKGLRVQVFAIQFDDASINSLACERGLASNSTRRVKGYFMGNQVACYYSVSTMGDRSILVYGPEGFASAPLLYFGFPHDVGR